MSSTTGMADTTQHPDVTEISDLTEGLLPPSRTAAVRKHIEGCPLCADVRASLEEIRGLLGTLPGPPRMPAEIAGRIDAALAAEALLDATTPDVGTDVSRETASTRPEPSLSSPPSPTADRPAGRPRAATGPGRPGRARRRRIAALGAAFGAAALGMSLFFVQGGVQTLSGESGDTKSDTAVRSAASGHFDGTPVEARVQALLHQEDNVRAPRGTAPESMSAEGGDTPMRGTAESAPGCVTAGTGRTEPVLAFQKGEYQGTAAYLLLLPHATDGSRVQAYVLDASCTDAGGKGRAKVLLTQSYPRS
ncbi:hypothetical protein GPZ77_17370 [Streptomyces sp. QHH-9511]|uniref:zf-HC2 domain-containing protein n=1 Tax=Streptomyces sp. QHH-9511 TaxID=2684468 RepID=UPI001317EAD9|nr:zf-HC2 domain-containing protein [Streptomyces sp. QHH-9511]QGZ49906.1 hypothetical protein GPZ77_17370 [Streptomyces sp. QHH-9511]